MDHLHRWRGTMFGEQGTSPYQTRQERNSWVGGDEQYTCGWACLTGAVRCIIMKQGARSLASGKPGGGKQRHVESSTCSATQWWRLVWSRWAIRFGTGWSESARFLSCLTLTSPT